MTSHPSLIAGARAVIDPLRTRNDVLRRVLVGIAGAPAAGKSTLATSLAGNYRSTDGQHAAVAVGMDGFHLANSELSRLGRTRRKGAPDTFDAYGFVAFLRRLRAADEPVVYAPMYSRTLHESIGGVVAVPAEVEVVIVEGNYLLVDEPPWDQIRSLLDLVIYLDTPSGVRVTSLLRRQRSRGLDRAAAQDWVYRSDEANADVVALTKARADVILARSA